MAAKKGGLGKKSGLGKGLDLLIPGAEEVEIVKESNEPSSMVPIEKVEPNRNQPRKQFEEDALNELAESIKKHGIINPIIVRKKDDYLEIVGGERRWRASKMAGLSEVPVIVRDLDDRAVAEIALIDNIQREDLNPIEEALAYKRLIEEFELTHDEVADRVSKSRAVITNSMRLLKLDEKVQQMLVDGMISSGHARQILALPEGEDQTRFAERVFDEKLSVHEVEKLVKKLKKPKTETPGSKSGGTSTQMVAIYADLEEQLKNHLGTKVRINAKDNDKGVIEIEYFSKEQMSELIEKLEA